MGAVVNTVAPDPLTALRAYHTRGPWSLRDLAAIAGAILGAARISPINAAARARPSERTIRFYVSRGLVRPPDGRGTAAVYHYRHLLEILGIKVRQMEGATLGAMASEFQGVAGDVLERRVAAALGPDIPSPDAVLRPATSWAAAPPAGASLPGAAIRRVPVAPGVDLLVDEHHPALLGGPAAEALAARIAAALRHSIPPAGTA
jgi:hypothetical protein